MDCEGPWGCKESDTHRANFTYFPILGHYTGISKIERKLIKRTQRSRCRLISSSGEGRVTLDCRVPSSLAGQHFSHPVVWPKTPHSHPNSEASGFHQLRIQNPIRSAGRGPRRPAADAMSQHTSSWPLGSLMKWLDPLSLQGGGLATSRKFNLSLCHSPFKPMVSSPSCEDSL